MSEYHRWEKAKQLFDLASDEYDRVKGKDRVRKIKESVIMMSLRADEMEIAFKNLKKDIKELEETKKKYLSDIKKYREAWAKRGEMSFFDEEQEQKVTLAIKRRQQELVDQEKELEKLKKENIDKEQEFLIRQEELEMAIEETNLSRQSYYRLTEAEMTLFNEQRPKILRGIEQWGSIALACKNDRTITMRPSSIMYYAKKHEQFAQDIDIARKVFKDNVDAEMIDRAFNGTKNPVFQKGEYIGDYAVKDNKLLVEVAKAKLPEEYNPRAYQQLHPTKPGGTTINILSFDGVDETKRGYAKNIGVVKSVDDSGRVERITQSAKMLKYYKEKDGAEVVIPENAKQIEAKE